LELCFAITFIVNVRFLKVKILMFYSVQTIDLTFVGKKIDL
jgi:hypothetical protein